MKFVPAFALFVALALPLPAYAQTIAAQEMTKDALPPDAAQDRIETVKADLASAIGTWKGVRSCGDRDRVRGALQGAFDRWIGQQTMARPGKLLLTYGWESASSWARNTKVDGRRKCKGGFHNAVVYARFY